MRKVLKLLIKLTIYPTEMESYSAVKKYLSECNSDFLAKFTKDV